MYNVLFFLFLSILIQNLGHLVHPLVFLSLEKGALFTSLVFLSLEKRGCCSPFAHKNTEAWNTPPEKETFFYVTMEDETEIMQNQIEGLYFNDDFHLQEITQTTKLIRNCSLPRFIYLLNPKLNPNKNL